MKVSLQARLANPGVARARVSAPRGRERSSVRGGGTGGPATVPALPRRQHRRARTRSARRSGRAIPPFHPRHRSRAAARLEPAEGRPARLAARSRPLDPACGSRPAAARNTLACAPLLASDVERPRRATRELRRNRPSLRRVPEIRRRVRGDVAASARTRALQGRHRQRRVLLPIATFAARGVALVRRRALNQAGWSLNSVISAGAKTRIGGPQNPVPRLTYSCESPRRWSPARYGWTIATSQENGQICPPCV